MSRTMKLLSAGALVLAGLNSQAQVTTLNYTGVMQTYTVPVGVTLIRIDAQGAQGGSVSTTCAATGGLGARMVGDVAVTPGEVLSIMVGQQGLTNGSDAGGGGGTFVVRAGNIPLVCAGGGGGATNNIGSCGANRNGINATITTSGTASANGIIAGGINGNGGGASGGSGGGGGGFLTDGIAGTGLPGSNGKSYLNGGAGGNGNNNDFGGYGGGGAGWFTGGNGGGGGGYSGGGTSGSLPFSGGGGGGSYNIGANQSNTAGFKTGNGLVVITVLYGVNITQSTQILCFGQASATLTAAPFGGTAPYTYVWAPSGGTSATATGLAAGTYTVTLTDAAAAVTTQTFTVTQPALLTATSSSTPISCFGGSDGSASVAPSGGTSPYTYLWSNGQTTLTTTGVVTGNYTCTVTCSNGCTTATSVTVTQPSVLSASLTATATACSGGNDGIASASATGGTSPYTYIWSNGGNTATINGLAAGVYTCTVTCSNGCTTSQSVTVTQPTAVTASATTSGILCNGDTATVTVVGAGGTSPYTGEGTFMEMAGTYSYTVTDANGCTSTTSVTITEPTAISTGVASVDVTCNGGADGSIDLTVSGGTGPYTFDWNNATYTTEDLTGLNAGTYVGVLTDANGCTDGGTIIINEPSALVATLAIANDTVCSTDGSFTLTGESPAGGVFSGPGVSAGSFSPATAGVGVHVITYVYTDSSGCTATTTDSIYVDVCTSSEVWNLESEVSIYPNPNNGTFTLQVASTSDVTIYDAQGKLVLSQKFQANVQNTLNLSTAGMYMITVVTADGQRTSQRVMVTK